MGKSRVQTRVEPDTQEKIDEYAEERNVGDAEALRRLIRTGLAAEGHPVTAADGGTPLERIASPNTIFLSMLGVMVTALCYISAWYLANTGDAMLAVGVLGLGAFTLVMSAAISVAAALAQLALARPLRGLVGLSTEDVNT